jgi:hypothetical protein
MLKFFRLAHGKARTLCYDNTEATVRFAEKAPGADGDVRRLAGMVIFKGCIVNDRRH